MNKKIALSILSLSAFITLASAQEVSMREVSDIDPDGQASSCLTLSSDIRFKMRDAVVGGNVTDLQDFLIANGLLQGESTGYFGAGTLRAVKTFQQKQGLSPTGFVGPKTREKIKSISCDASLSEERLPEIKRERASSQPGAVKSETSGSPTLPRQEMVKKVEEHLSAEDKLKLQTLEQKMKQAEKEVRAFYAEWSSKLESGSADTAASYKKLSEEKSKTWMASQKALEEAKREMMERAKMRMSDEERKALEMGNIGNMKRQAEDRKKSEDGTSGLKSKFDQENLSEADKQNIKALEIALQKAEKERDFAYIEWSKTKSETNIDANMDGRIPTRDNLSSKEYAYETAKKSLKEAKKALAEKTKMGMLEEERINSDRKMKERENKKYQESLKRNDYNTIKKVENSREINNRLEGDRVDLGQVRADGSYNTAPPATLR